MVHDAILGPTPFMICSLSIASSDFINSSSFKSIFESEIYFAEFNIYFARNPAFIADNSPILLRDDMTLGLGKE